MAVVYTLKQSAIARDEEVWMGIDAHKASWAVTILGSEGVLHQGSYEAKRSHLEGLVDRLPGCRIHAVYEAGPTGYKLLMWLRQMGCEALMTPPSLVPIRAGDRVKTDRRDSAKLAELLRAGLLKPIFDLKEETYHHRELVRTRAQLIEHRSDICRQIKSKLLSSS